MSNVSKNTAGIFIGRFQPLHNGHIEIINKMIQEVDHPVIIVGSASGPRTPLNPFTFQERVKMLQDVFGKQITIYGADDYKYQDNDWLVRINTIIDTVKRFHSVESEDVAIYGYRKDDSSQYLGWFPAYKYKEVVGQSAQLNSTNIREMMFCPYFKPANITIEEACRKAGVNEKTCVDICKYYNEDWYGQLRNEFEYIKAYKKQSQFVSLPFKPIFVAVDALVVCGGNILLIRRGGRLGNNLIAIPGGFLNHDESIHTGLFRELKEETKIDVPPAVLKNSLKHTEVFDDPRRSMRGRTITHCGLIVLQEKTLPKVKGSDDAKEAFWVPINQLDSYKNMFFEDHYFIIKKMLTKL
jgi:bifunctional NMN adenylyltransferase/nudix hydrolase